MALTGDVEVIGHLALGIWAANAWCQMTKPRPKPGFSVGNTGQCSNQFLEDLEKIQDFIRKFEI